MDRNRARKDVQKTAGERGLALKLEAESAAIGENITAVNLTTQYPLIV